MSNQRQKQRSGRRVALSPSSDIQGQALLHRGAAAVGGPSCAREAALLSGHQAAELQRGPRGHRSGHCHSSHLVSQWSWLS